MSDIDYIITQADLFMDEFMKQIIDFLKSSKEIPRSLTKDKVADVVKMVAEQLNDYQEAEFILWIEAVCSPMMCEIIDRKAKGNHSDNLSGTQKDFISKTIGSIYREIRSDKEVDLVRERELAKYLIAAAIYRDEHNNFEGEHYKSLSSMLKREIFESKSTLIFPLQVDPDSVEYQKRKQNAHQKVGEILGPLNESNQQVYQHGDADQFNYNDGGEQQHAFEEPPLPASQPSHAPSEVQKPKPGKKESETSNNIDESKPTATPKINLRKRKTPTPAEGLGNSASVGTSSVSDPEAAKKRQLEEYDYFVGRNNLVLAVRTLYRRLKRLDVDVDEIEIDKNAIKAILSQLESVEKALAPKRVAVVGELSAGKSTFLSHLLGCPDLFLSGNGAVTSVLTEVHYIPSQTFRAQLIYLSREDLTEDICFYKQEKERRDRQLAASMDDGDEEDDAEESDARFDSVVYRLCNYFELDMEGNIDFSKEKKAALKYVGKSVEIIDGKLDAVKNGLHAVLKSDPTDPEQKHKLASLKLIRIQGPFKHLPAGVVLVDTPGMGDADQMRSQKTLDSLNQFQGIWYANDVAYSMSKLWDQQFLRKIINLENLKGDVHVVGTKADDKTGRNESGMKIYEKNILDVVYKDYLMRHRNISEQRLSGGRQFMMDRVRELPAAVQQELKDVASAITVNFTSVTGEGEFGFEKWHSVLQQYSKGMKEMLDKQKDVFRVLIAKFLEKVNIQGRTTERNLSKEFEKEYKELRKVLDSILSAVTSSSSSDRNIATMVKNITDLWKSFHAHANTIRAIMGPNRAGKFERKVRKTTVSVTKGLSKRTPAPKCTVLNFDLNEDIAVEWQRVICSAWTKFQDKVHSWATCLTSEFNAGALALNLVSDIKEIGKEVFEIDAKIWIQSELAHQGVYAEKCKTFPTEQQLQELFQSFRGEIDRVLQNIRSCFTNAVNTVSTCSNPVSRVVFRLLEEFDEQLQALNSVRNMNTGEVMIPIEYACREIDGDYHLMEDPVRTSCCGKLVDKHCMGKLPPVTCILCKKICLHLTDMFELKDRIGIWKQVYMPSLSNEATKADEDWWIEVVELGRTNIYNHDQNNVGENPAKKLKK